MKQYASKSVTETKKIAKNIAKTFKGGEVLGLVGNLGTGKTHFTKGLAEYFEIKNPITSPTFVVMKVYDIKGNKYINKMSHADAYRLETGEDALAIGLGEYIENNKCLTVIEWAERIKDVLPKDTIWVKFNYGDSDNERIINIK